MNDWMDYAKGLCISVVVAVPVTWLIVDYMNHYGR